MGHVELNVTTDCWGRPVYIEMKDDRVQIGVKGLEHQRGIVLNYHNVHALRAALEDVCIMHQEDVSR